MELKDCPFCGGYAVGTRVYSREGISYPCVMCGECGAKVVRKEYEQAVTDWNRRVADDSRDSSDISAGTVSNSSKPRRRTKKTRKTAAGQ